MAWWQVVLIIVGAIVIGLTAGYVLNRVIIRTSAAVKRPEKAPVRQPVPQAVYQPADVEPTVPDLYAEIEYNRRIASDDWKGEPQPFLTRAWDNRGEEVHSLPVQARNELTEAYSDMALANSITWLSTEMGRRSESLDESYLKLRSSVAERLNRVKLQLTYAGQAPKITSLQ
ncbi:MAG: hypothetical protein A2147_04955 [Chloroflexi bacterium RBG_16_57_8]|nr:MAG: hypothetical protein A2147_04955 [Chloroflexi bacterium RBG_16_57_8]